MAEPINTNPATRANAEHNADTSRIGDDDILERIENVTSAGYRTTTASDRLPDVVEQDIDTIASDPTVYDVRVIRAGETSGTTTSTTASVYDDENIEDTQEIPVVTSATANSDTYLASNAGAFDLGTIPGTATTPAPNDELEAARAQIEETRARLAGNVEAIKEKLSPANLVEEAKEAAVSAVTEKVDEVKSAVADKVSDVAGAVGGVAATVTEKAKDLVASASVVASATVAHVNELAHTAAEKVQDVLHSTGPKAQNALDTAKTTAQAALDTASDRAKSAARSASIQASSLAHSAGQTAKGAGTTVVDTIRLNPLPAALIGVGVGWLLLSIRKQNSLAGNYEARLPNRDLLPYDDSSTYTPYGSTSGSTIASNPSLYSPSTSGRIGELADTAREKAGDLADTAREKVGDMRDKAGDIVDTAREKASDLADTAREKASDLAGTAREKAGDLADSARDLATGARDKASDLAEAARGKASEFADSARGLADSARDKAGDLAAGAKDKSQQAVSVLDTFVHENPIAAGAIALMVGVTVGLLLPGTSKENELLGPTRDRLADQATAAASDMAQKAQKVAGAALGTAKESFAEVKDTVKQQFDDAKDAVKDTVKQQLDEAKETVKTEAQNQGLPTDVAVTSA